VRIDGRDPRVGRSSERPENLTARLETLQRERDEFSQLAITANAAAAQLRMEARELREKIKDLEAKSR
jgi:seryl-tRNA synthetase